jgi:hypothetical protein
VLPCADEFFVWAPISRARLVLRFGAPVKDLLRFWAPIWPTRLAFPLETPGFFPTAPLSLALCVLLVARPSWRLASVLGAPLADSPCVPSGTPKFSPHRTSVAGSFGFVGWALLLATRLGFGRPSGRLALRYLWKPQVFTPPHLCRLLFGFCWLGAPLGDSPRCWAPLWPTRLAFPLEPPSFLPTARLSPALSDLLAGRSSWRLASVLGAPLADSPSGTSGNPKFSPHRTSVAGSLGFAGWALLLATRLGVGRPYGRLALRSLWKPQVFTPPHLCRWLFGFCWLGAPLGDSPPCSAPLWPTRLAVPLETPSFHPTAPLSLALCVFLFGRSSWRLASVFGAPLADSPCVPSGNPKFSLHHTSVAGSLGFVGWALLLATRLGVRRPSGRLALRSLWKPQVFSPPHLCRRLIGFCWLGAPLGDSPRCWAPLWPTRLAFPLETPSFLPTAPLSPALWVLLVGRSSWRLASVLGAPLADSPCVPSGNPKFSPHRTSVAVLSVLLVGRSSCRLASVLGAPLADSPCVPSGNPKFFPHRASVAVLSVLLVGRSSCRLVSVLGAPLADSPCVPSGNPKFFPHRTSVAGSFGFVGWALLLATRLGFGRPSGRLALRSLWKPQVFSPPRLCRCSFGFVGWALLLATRLGFGRPSGRLALRSLWKPQVFSPPRLCRCSFGFVGWALLLPTRLGFGRPFGRLALRSLWKPQVFSPPRLCRCSFGFVGWALLLPSLLGFGRPSGRLALRSVWKPQVFSPPRHCRCSFGFVGWALLLATRFGFGRPFGRLALRSLWKPQVFPPPRLCRCSFDFVGWALLLPTRLGFGRPSGRLSLRSVWKPQVFSPPRHCRCSFGFVGWALLLTTRFGFGRSSSPRFWAPLWPTRLAFRLETPSFFPTAPLSLFFRFCWLGAPLDHSLRFWALLFASVLGAPLADSPCVPSGNPKFFPHRDTVAVLSVLLVGRSS